MMELLMAWRRRPPGRRRRQQQRQQEQQQQQQRRRFSASGGSGAPRLLVVVGLLLLAACSGSVRAQPPFDGKFGLLPPAGTVVVRHEDAWYRDNPFNPDAVVVTDADVSPDLDPAQWLPPGVDGDDDGAGAEAAGGGGEGQAAAAAAAAARDGSVPPDVVEHDDDYWPAPPATPRPQEERGEVIASVYGLELTRRREDFGPALPYLTEAELAAAAAAEAEGGAPPPPRPADDGVPLAPPLLPPEEVVAGPAGVGLYSFGFRVALPFPYVWRGAPFHDAELRVFARLSCTVNALGFTTGEHVRPALHGLAALIPRGLADAVGRGLLLRTGYSQPDTGARELLRPALVTQLSRFSSNAGSMNVTPVAWDDSAGGSPRGLWSFRARLPDVDDARHKHHHQSRHGGDGGASFTRRVLLTVAGAAEAHALPDAICSNGRLLMRGDDWLTGRRRGGGVSTRSDRPGLRGGSSSSGGSSSGSSSSGSGGGGDGEAKQEGAAEEEPRLPEREFVGSWTAVGVPSGAWLPLPDLARLALLHHAHHQALGFAGTLLMCAPWQARALAAMPPVQSLVATKRLIVWTVDWGEPLVRADDDDDDDGAEGGGSEAGQRHGSSSSSSSSFGSVQSAAIARRYLGRALRMTDGGGGDVDGDGGGDGDGDGDAGDARVVVSHSFGTLRRNASALLRGEQGGEEGGADGGDGALLEEQEEEAAKAWGSASAAAAAEAGAQAAAEAAAVDDAAAAAAADARGRLLARFFAPQTTQLAVLALSGHRGARVLFMGLDEWLVLPNATSLARTAGAPACAAQPPLAGEFAGWRVQRHAAALAGCASARAGPGDLLRCWERVRLGGSPWPAAAIGAVASALAVRRSSNNRAGGGGGGGGEGRVMAPRAGERGGAEVAVQRCPCAGGRALVAPAFLRADHDSPQLREVFGRMEAPGADVAPSCAFVMRLAGLAAPPLSAAPPRGHGRGDGAKAPRHAGLARGEWGPPPAEWRLANAAKVPPMAGFQGELDAAASCERYHRELSVECAVVDGDAADGGRRGGGASHGPPATTSPHWRAPLR